MVGSGTLRLPWISRGKPFLGHTADLLLVGGVLALAFGLCAHLADFHFNNERFWVVVLTVSYAHFAASTVRLYTRPGVVREWPFLAVGVPIMTLVATSLLLLAPRPVWRHIEGVYLTWSTYHYAAQTFGLAVMYAYRSGCQLSDADRRWVRATCLLPFVYGLLGSNSGLAALMPESLWGAGPLAHARLILRGLLLPLMLAAPVVVHLWIRHKSARVLPLISACLMLTNAVSWSFFLDHDAFAWAAVAHGVQYLVIIAYFHSEEAARAPENRHGKAYHAVTFYLACLALGYLLFEMWPAAYGLASINLDRPSTFRHVAFIINMHHFLVDGFIWRLRRDRGLARTIERPANAL